MKTDLVTKNYRNFQKIQRMLLREMKLFIELIFFKSLTYGASFISMISKTKAKYYLKYQ